MVNGCENKVIPAFYVILIVISLIASFSGFNYYFDINDYALFHIISETLFTVLTASIFLITNYSYPYERNQKYIIPGMLFISAAIFNTYHIYYAFDLNMLGFRLRISNFVNIIMCITIYLFILIPEKSIRIKRRAMFIIPVFFTTLFFVYALSAWNINSGAIGHHLNMPDNQNVISGILEVAYISALLIAFKKHRENKNEQNISTLNVILCCIIYILYLMLNKKPNDIYAVLSHIFKVIASLYIIKIYFIAFIKSPYKKIVESKRTAEDTSNIKTDFIINLSHELRTPINVILNAAKLVEGGKDNRYVKSIEKAAHRLNKVCESILEFHQIENGSISIHHMETDVIFLIDEILEEAEEIADDKELEIIFDFKNNDIILTDSDKIGRIILNLISNSIKYAPRGGLVNIELDIKNNLTLKVFNNGPNIPQEEILNIFNKFYKVKHQDLESTEGLGIGLYIAKRYAEALGGYIKVLNNGNLTGYVFEMPVNKVDKPSSTTNSYNVKGFFSDIC